MTDCPPTLAVLEDAKYKRRDALKGLAESAARMVKEGKHV